MSLISKLLKRKEPRDLVLVSRISMCGRCGQVFINVDEVPNHLCVATTCVQMTHSFDFNTDTTTTAQYRDFTITRGGEE